ncbi:DinB family protein [Acinetobacter guerrae]|uniref:DinB family protein n=1 Tax=Acinetobacter guerrae TaxID=1843371 RepID=UPI00128BD773|nr:DinB family protein [Acinetobacter guerrae]MPW45828.1 damage-inducible protein DinB [Acinetobacter guerrae]
MTDPYKISKQSLLLLAEYNIWATHQLLQSLRQLSHKELQRDTGLFFKSIFGTLNHLLVGEHFLWYVRFSQSISPHLRLNAIVETDIIKLLDQLESKSHRWIPLIQQLDDVTLNGVLNYQTTSGEQKCLPFAATLLHVFNHGTHHRAQITAALTALGYTCPILDLVYMLLEKHP